MQCVARWVADRHSVSTQEHTQIQRSAENVMPAREMVVVENVNCPGRTANVDAVKYSAMKKALLKVLPRKPPGLTQRQMFDAIQAHLSEELWPNGSKSHWWAKTVQLDLEAKNILVRTDNKPLTWYRR